ncbi:hypothetical protein AB4Z46_19025 [Variovorax sp. M-6]|uniref:hypothetical protein n=1 Tax=Variovorax sp. M-6 TaxID=3233041 RepID=UPI003F96739E
MTDNEGPLAAKMKLALSRAELLAAMGYREVLEGPAEERIEPLTPLSTAADSPPQLRLAPPWLQRYAQVHPGRLVAGGVGTGALLVLLMPWRLLVAAALAGLLFKTLASPKTAAPSTPAP